MVIDYNVRQFHLHRHATTFKDPSAILSLFGKKEFDKYVRF